MKLRFEHPNGGWQGIQSECDGRNFLILNNWVVANDNGQEPMPTDGYSLFKFGVIDNVIVDFVSMPYLEHDIWHIETNVGASIASLITPIQVEVFKVCPASDPHGMVQPLYCPGYKMYFLKVPETILPMAYIRIMIPHSKV